MPDENEPKAKPPRKRRKRGETVVPKRTFVAPRAKRSGKGSGKPGHPSLMTAQTVALLLSHLRTGLHRETAASLVGLGTDTFKSWLAKGRREVEAAEAKLQSEGVMPRHTKWGNFFVEVLRAEAQSEAGQLGVLTEISTARGPSPGLDENGQPKPGPLLYPAEAASAVKWQLSRKNNLRYGNGSQRTDLVRSTGDEDDTASEAGDFVMQALARALSVKDASERASGDE